MSKELKAHNIGFFVFEIYSRYFIFDSFKNIWSEIDVDEYKMFLRIIEERKYDENWEIFIKALLEKELFLKDDTRNGMCIDPGDETNDELYLSFLAVHQCNLDCEYCYARAGRKEKEENKKLTEKVLFDALNFFLKVKYPQKKFVRFDFVGVGETLLNFDIVQSLVEYVQTLTIDTKIWLCTNGTLLSKNIARYLDKNKINIGISIDGDKDTHDKNRYFSNGQGSYDIICNNITNIICSNEFSNNFKNIWGLTVVTPDTTNIMSVLKHHYRLGLNNVQLKVIINSVTTNGISASNCWLFIEKYQVFVQELTACFTENKKYLLMILNENDTFGKVIVRLLSRSICYYRCAAGVNKFSISASGDVYPCDGFVGIEEYRMGSIYTDVVDKNDRFRDNSVFSKPECKTCWIKFVCGGNCPKDSYSRGGSIYSNDEAFCTFNRELVKLAIYLLNFIKKTSPEFYEYMRKLCVIRNDKGVK